MNQKIKEYINIEEDFFNLDKENRLAHMKLEFVTPRDLFDTNSITKTPVFNDEFTEWLKASFEYAPKKYKIDLDIALTIWVAIAKTSFAMPSSRTPLWNSKGTKG